MRREWEAAAEAEAKGKAATRKVAKDITRSFTGDITTVMRKIAGAAAITSATMNIMARVVAVPGTAWVWAVSARWA